jgi:hypothetical protein
VLDFRGDIHKSFGLIPGNLEFQPSASSIANGRKSGRCHPVQSHPRRIMESRSAPVVVRPRIGQEWRINFSRVEWNTNIENGN